MFISASFRVHHLLIEMKKGIRICSIVNQIRYRSELNVNQSLDILSSTNHLNSAEKEKGSFEKFNLHEETQKRLKARGIEYLFPVQYVSFNDIIVGKDCIVQARTGTGKTLAFSLPIIERLQKEVREMAGRYPRCLVLEPTRELAKQITDDFLSIKRHSLSIATLYGGKQYSEQEHSLKKGSDIVVGTPGRIKDFLNQKKLFLHQCQTIVLDEVDRMLDMGFQDDVDSIIQNVSNQGKKAQMIVFSATIPEWLKKSVSRYMSREQFSFHNLIQDSQGQTPKNVEHFAVKFNEIRRRDEMILCLFEKYSSNLEQSQVIIFCQTKRECDQLAHSNQLHSYPTAVLHGDLSQNKREQVLQNFRRGNIRLLITTDISARGLDIPQVDLVILTSPPQDWESYVHRSGRTGRAGKAGKSICIYSNQQIQQLKLVQRNAKIQFTDIPVQSLPSFSRDHRQEMSNSN